jgi:hypothetical protein
LRLIEHGRDEIIWPTLRVQSEVYNTEQRGAVAFATMVDPVALLAWMFKDQLLAALGRELATEADGTSPALSNEAREKAEAEVMQDLLAVEFEEAALVWRAQSEGLPVEHRADCSPLAILQVRLITAPRADVPATSAGLSWSMRR